MNLNYFFNRIIYLCEQVAYRDDDAITELIAFFEKTITTRERTEFLEDWSKIWAVKPIESAYTHYSITEPQYKSIKEKWEGKK